jgi:integrase
VIRIEHRHERCCDDCKAELIEIVARRTPYLHLKDAERTVNAILEEMAGALIPTLRSNREVLAPSLFDTGCRAWETNRKRPSQFLPRKSECHILRPKHAVPLPGQELSQATAHGRVEGVG